MNMKCAIMQPTYLPWMGYFDLIDQVDIFVFLDHVQLNKRSWQTRNKIKTTNGALLLTIPIKKGLSREKTTIHRALIFQNENWKERHLKSIKFNYRTAEFFDEIFPFIKSLLLSKDEHLGDFNINIIKSIANKLGINTKLVRSSEFKNIDGRKDELLVNICKKIKCKNYLSVLGSKNYINKDNLGGAFAKSCVNLYYNQYNHPKHKQLHGDFISHLCILDVLFNYGFNKSLKIINQGRGEKSYYKELK